MSLSLLIKISIVKINTQNPTLIYGKVGFCVGFRRDKAQLEKSIDTVMSLIDWTIELPIILCKIWSL